MAVFLFILSMAFLCAAVCSFFYFDTKLRELRRQYRLLNNQYNALKKKASLTSETKSKNDFKIKYVTPSFISGITKPNINIFISPIDENPISSLKEPVDIKILEECVIANNIWLYVDLETENNINSRAWIEKKNFSFLKDRVQII